MFIVGSLVILSLQIFSWFWQWKNFENRLIFGKVEAYKDGDNFLGHPVHTSGLDTWRCFCRLALCQYVLFRYCICTIATQTTLFVQFCWTNNLMMMMLMTNLTCSKKKLSRQLTIKWFFKKSLKCPLQIYEIKNYCNHNS